MLRVGMLATLLIVLPLAGCVTGNEDAGKTIAGRSNLTGPGPRTIEAMKQAAYEEIKGLMNGVPCTVANVGAATSANLKLLTNISYERGGSNEIDIKGDWLVAARGGGFALLNISDPLRAYFYSNWTETKSNLDVKFSPDNKTVLVGAGWGIDLVDISNPFEPMRAGQWRFDSAARPPSGMPLQNAHMIYTARIAGKDWVFVAANSNTGVWILELMGPPEQRTLRFVTTTLPLQGGPLGPHDMYVQYDTTDKKWYLYSADGFHGWTVFDITNPASPTIAGGILRPETGYTHTIQAHTIGNRRIVATIQEVGVNIMEVYDATILQAPVLLGVWQVTPGSAAPQHNFNIVDGKLYLAHYGNGIYVFDLKKLGSTPLAGTAELQPMAHYAAGGSSNPVGFTHFWDAVLKDGILYGSNMVNGLHIIGFGCNEPGNVLLTSDG